MYKRQQSGSIPFGKLGGIAFFHGACLRLSGRLVATCLLYTSDSALDAPSVMLNVPYGDSWFMPSTQSYAARLIADAGGHYVYQKNTGNASVPIDMEEAYLLASDADMWLNVGMANSLDELKASCPKFTDTRCFKNGNVYNNNARTNAGGGNDYYESAVVNPDIVLRDLVKIFHPELVQEECVYYKRLK